MAIVFVSPKKRQRALQLTVILALVIFCIAVGLYAFFDELAILAGYGAPSAVASVPEIKINFSVVDSEKVKKLQPFELLEGQVSPGRQNPFATYEQITVPKKK